MVYNLNTDLVTQYVAGMSDELGIQVTAAKSVEELMTQSQCVVTGTPAKQAESHQIRLPSVTCPGPVSRIP